MDNIFLPVCGAYLEINGEKIGSVEKYKERVSRDNLIIESIGEYEPIANLYGQTRYYIELSQIYIYTILIGGENNIKEISNFELAVETVDKKVIYSGCEWLEINKSMGADSYIYEDIKVAATKRRETLNVDY